MNKIALELARTRTIQRNDHGDILIDSLISNPFQLLIIAPTGYGKSSVVRHLINGLEYDKLLIVSTECQEGGEYDSYSEDIKMPILDLERLEALRTRDDKRKLLIFDDIMSMGMRKYNASTYIEGFCANARHFGISIVTSLQVVKGAPTGLIDNCNAALIATLNDRTKKVHEALTGMKLNQLQLEPHSFLFINNRGTRVKIKIGYDDH